MRITRYGAKENNVIARCKTKNTLVSNFPEFTIHPYLKPDANHATRKELGHNNTQGAMI
jgi:hypothetical protein